MMKHVIKCIDNLNHVLEYHKAGHLDVRCVPLLHSLNWTNCVEKDLVRRLFCYMFFVDLFQNI
jgi:hypothetical protein